VHTALRAAAAGIVEGLTWEEIITGLHMGTTQLRLVAVRAESGALILDDTYNASPQSTLAALNLLEELDGNRVAVLGDMLELGPYEKEGHEVVGGRAAEIVHELICIGPRAKMIAEAALQAGMSSQAIAHFDQTADAAAFLAPRLTSRDVVLVKGSHGMRMDRLVAMLEARR
jgi:UDP-N-acetylmuramoyl-tripeptide--D-alanyl-D-alanine ligase